MAGEDDAKVLRFPTRRKRAVKNPTRSWEQPISENVRRLWAPRALREPRPLTPAGYFVLALHEALRRDSKTRARSGGPDVIGELQGMFVRWEDDPEVQVGVRAALSMVFAHKTGRSS